MKIDFKQTHSSSQKDELVERMVLEFNTFADKVDIMKKHGARNSDRVIPENMSSRSMPAVVL